ncbi:MAG: BolA family protein [Polyangiales bacterium]
MSDLAAHIESTLKSELQATAVEVVDESHLHAGHAGARGGAKHFRVRVVSPMFSGKSLVQRHRMVNALFAEELKHAIHALALDTRAPGE